MAKFDHSELLEYFLLEAEDHINHLDKGISELDTSHDKGSLIENLLISAHTLKGAAAIVKLTATSNIAHKMEDILEEIKDGKITASKKIIEALLYMLDAIKGLVRDISSGKGEGQKKEDEVFLKVSEIISKEDIKTSSPAAIALPEKPGPAESPVSALPEKRGVPGRRKEDYEFFSGSFVKVDLRKVEEMLNLIGEVTIKKNYLMQRVKGTEGISDEIFFAGRRLLKEVNSFAERYAYSSLPDNVKYIDPLLSEFGELEFDRYDELNLFSRKLQEITNDITEALKGLSDFFGSFGDDVKTMDSLIRLIRTHISETRMIDIGRLFQRFVRPVRDMAVQHGKKADLLTSGGDTHIDKVIFERLFEPLLHLVRNAISHGIEKPEERIQKGKKEEGLILLSARRDGDAVIIEVHDDGRGINIDRLFERAVEMGILKAGDRPSKEELLTLIFTPGFSMAKTADMTSGRGMGMSAARKMVAAVNGIIEIAADTETGTRFRIKVPSSLAITNVVVFASHSIEFVMPSSFVEEIIQFNAKDRPDGTTEKLHYRGRDIYAKKLSDLLGIAGRKDAVTQFVIICNVTDKKVGLIVDAILGQEETIIKPLHRFLSGLNVYSGMTLSGAGKVRLVLNPMRIFEQQIQPLAPMTDEVEEYNKKKVLIVDDSLSVRKYVSAFLDARQFEVYAASNGVEALNILDETLVDMIITDLEMPVMHGYELISRIKRLNQSKDVPIIVLTSRSAEKHKEKALQLGAEDYLVKPFDEKSFEDILRKYFFLPI